MAVLSVCPSHARERLLTGGKLRQLSDTRWWDCRFLLGSRCASTRAGRGLERACASTQL